MHVTPTLHFNGQCEKAIELYKEAFHCKIDCLLHYSDANNQYWDISRMS
jgi:PhnB protein